MDEIRTYFDRMAPAFDDYYRQPRHNLVSRIGHVVFRRPGLIRRFQATIDFLGDPRDKRILDAGCGPGAYCVYLWKRGAHVTGVDLSSAMIDTARANAAQAGWEGPDLRVGDVSAMNGVETYDAVIAIGVFDYLEPTVRTGFLWRLTELTHGPVIASFPKLFTPQSPVRRLYFVGKECPVFFYTAREVRRLAAGVDRRAVFANCGPIWTVAFEPADE